MKILIIGGTWDKNDGKPSGVIAKIADAVQKCSVSSEITVRNGGNYDDIETYLNNTPDFDIVFWFANVPNDLPKIRDVKAVAPHVMLVSSKRNDNNKYDFKELIQRALASKSNLVFMFSKPDNNDKFEITVFDPLGNRFCKTDDIELAVRAAMERLVYLKSVTRQPTAQSEENKDLCLKQYFDSLKQDILESDKNVETPDEQKFIELVRKYAEKFHELMDPGKDVKRFIGNCSLRPEKSGFRCTKGMPSFRHDDYIFVSQRNVDKEYIDISHFVPVYRENGKIYYCGNNKPSVDTPIQLKLYENLPNIKYMLHSHCYAKGAEFTSKCIPCGAVEEADEILRLIGSDINKDFYIINLKGHGSIIMSGTLEAMRNIEFYSRPIPEDI